METCFLGAASDQPLTTDEMYGLIQISIMVLGLLAFVLIFVYLAYEKPSS